MKAIVKDQVHKLGIHSKMWRTAHHACVTTRARQARSAVSRQSHELTQAQGSIFHVAVHTQPIARAQREDLRSLRGEYRRRVVG